MKLVVSNLYFHIISSVHSVTPSDLFSSFFRTLDSNSIFKMKYIILLFLLLTTRLHLYHAMSHTDSSCYLNDTNAEEILTKFFNDAYAGAHPCMLIENWDVSNVKDMSHWFEHKATFNHDISRWCVAQVTSMAYMFRNASSFNGDLSNWAVSKLSVSFPSRHVP